MGKKPEINFPPSNEVDLNLVLPEIPSGINLTIPCEKCNTPICDLGTVFCTACGTKIDLFYRYEYVVSELLNYYCVEIDVNQDTIKGYTNEEQTIKKAIADFKIGDKNKMIRSKESANRDLTNELRILESNIANLNDDLKKIKSASHDLNRKSDNYEKHLKTIGLQNSDLKEKKNDYLIECQKNEIEKNRLNQIRLNLQSKDGKLAEECEITNKQVDDFKKDLTKNKNALNNLYSQQQDLVSIKNIENDEIDSLLKKNATLISEIEHLSTDRTKVHNLINECNNRIHNKYSEIIQQNAGLTKSKINELFERYKDINKLEQITKKKLCEKELKLSHFRSEKSKLDHEIKLVEEGIAQCKSDLKIDKQRYLLSNVKIYSSIILIVLLTLLVSFLLLYLIGNSKVGYQTLTKNQSFLVGELSREKYSIQEQELLGKYSGFFYDNNNEMQSFYLTIKRNSLDTTQLTSYLLYDIKKGVKKKVLKFNKNNLRISIDLIGDGIVSKNLETGAIRIKSTSENKIKWEFSK